MIIEALSEFGMDLSEERLTTPIGESLRHHTESDLVIDFSGCILDYPATARIVDGALEGMDNVSGPRKLTLIFNIAFQELLCIKWYFFFGRLIPKESSEDSLEILKERLDAELIRRGVKVVLAVRDNLDGPTRIRFAYG
jgi:hypothetical protein